MLTCFSLTSPSAGADKKAEAGAGAATEFQFVSITGFHYFFPHQFFISNMKWSIATIPALLKMLLGCGHGFYNNSTQQCQSQIQFMQYADENMLNLF